MNKNILRNYAPKARKAFIQAITDKAAIYGISAKNILPCEIRGDFAIIDGKPFPKVVHGQRQELVEKVKDHSFSYAMEEIAYTWFNRFAAIRFMEINGYLSHGYRVLSHPEGHNIPEIVEKAQFIERLDGLEKDEIIRLKLAGDKDDELYRKLIMAQCNELNNAMPFLFEKVDDPTELLLPDNLLHTGSIIRDMVNTIPEGDWHEVEIIGWLYQFYISGKKDELIQAKKAYKSEDIPAVTQLFTPNWIVKYLVQNSLGAKWLRTYPNSSLKSKMEYYIEPAEQTPEVKEELEKVTPSLLNPEEITVLDPACGSGHILVEAYDLLKEIYLERGYRKRDVPQLILEKNLFGLEIDHRAAQLAGFALMMKARKDDSGIFERDVKPNVLVIEGVTGEGAMGWLKVFENADTFGSLIRIPVELRDKLSDIKSGIDELEKKDDLLTRNIAEGLRKFVRQAELLSREYDVVVANPPYMGNKFLNMELKGFLQDNYEDVKSDLFSAFIMRNRDFAKPNGLLGFMSPFVWMFISSYEKLREALIDEATLDSLIQLEYSGFAEATVPICTFVFQNNHIKGYMGSFIRLSDFRGAENQAPKTLEAIRNKDCGWFYEAKPDDFKKIPGSPIAYWAKPSVRKCFEFNSIEQKMKVRSGLTSGDKQKFTRAWWEIIISDIGFGMTKEKAIRSYLKWFPHNAGGEARRWYGNRILVINWKNDGLEIKKQKNSTIRNPDYYFREGITWTDISSSFFCARYLESGFIFENTGSMIFSDHKDMPLLHCYMSSSPVFYFMNLMNPTMHFGVGEVAKLPFKENLCKNILDQIENIHDNCIINTKMDWDSSETSWNFQYFPLFSPVFPLSSPSGKKEEKSAQTQSLYVFDPSSLSISYTSYRSLCQHMTDTMKNLEEENNRIFIEAYGLGDELTSDVPIEEITLFANPKYRYKGDLSDEELESRFKADTMKELMSYAIGCIMGRYSLDQPGLVYAHSANAGFDPSKYETFPADSDGIIPITDSEWFDDDIALRFVRFIGTAWDKSGLEDNLDFIADAIGRRSGESSRDAIRRYFVNDFFKDHLQRYKKRPIYWLFSSGKQKAFQALVYLHRYNEGTLARMRTEYVLPLQSMLARRIENLDKDRESASSTSAANRIQKEIDSLRKQRDELLGFDEKLRHYADMKIKLDLDDGVKVNYGKFGDLLAEVKAITGSSE